MSAGDPQTVGRYQIVRRLGEGGMGMLYLATDPLLQRTVAIKVLTGSSAEFRERFAREARSVASLKHPHIVAIYDIGSEGGRPFLAMEYVDGSTIAAMIRERTPVDIARRLQILLELCDGLGYAHRAGIIHRDIKPANLMVTSEGVLKILDFGLARMASEATGLTSAGMLIGTPNYMSPERISGRPVDQRSDIFAVGLVAYELLAFRRAYSGDSPGAVLKAILTSEPEPLGALNPQLDPRIVSAVEKAMRKDPDLRYANLSMFAADLSAALAPGVEYEATILIRRTSDQVPREDTPSIPPPTTPEASDKRASEVRQQTVSGSGTTGAPTPAAGATGENARMPAHGPASAIDERRQLVADQYVAEGRKCLDSGDPGGASRLAEATLALMPQHAGAEELRDRARALLQPSGGAAPPKTATAAPAPSAPAPPAPATPMPTANVGAARSRVSRGAVLAVVCCAAIAVAAAGTWWVRRTPPTIASPTASSTTTAKPAVAPKVETPLPVPAPASTPDAPVGTESATQIASRTLNDGDLAAAAEAAQRARTKAVNADGGRMPPYQDGRQKQDQAAALTDPAQLVQAVALYQQAGKAYDAATAAAQEVARLARSAAAALARGDTAAALTQAGKALTRDRESAPVLAVISEIRTAARRAAASARADAIAQHAQETGAFKEGEASRAAADLLTGPRQARQQAAAFERARAKYASAVADVSAQHTAAAHHALDTARSALKDGDLQAARQALGAAVSAQPDIEGAAAVRAGIEAAERQRAAKAAVNPADRAAISKALEAYVAAYRKLDAKDVAKAAPYMDGASQRYLANTFKSLESLTMQMSCAEPTLWNNGEWASARCTIVQTRVAKKDRAETLRTDIADIALKKKDGRWTIVSIQNNGR